jgi:hypothetical protein
LQKTEDRGIYIRLLLFCFVDQWLGGYPDVERARREGFVRATDRCHRRVATTEEAMVHAHCQAPRRPFGDAFAWRFERRPGTAFGFVSLIDDAFGPEITAKGRIGEFHLT